MPLPPSPKHARNHTSRLGRLIAAVDEYRAKFADLLFSMQERYDDAERSPVTFLHRRIAEYELKHGEQPDPELMEAVYNLIDKYNGFRDMVRVDYAPSREAEAVIIEERTLWNATHKRNEYMAAAQARRRAKVAGQRDILADDLVAYNERSAQHPPADPKPWTDEELASGVWKTPTDVPKQEVTDSTEIVEDERVVYERKRAERQQREAELLANRQGSPLLGGIKR